MFWSLIISKWSIQLILTHQYVTNNEKPLITFTDVEENKQKKKKHTSVPALHKYKGKGRTKKVKNARSLLTLTKGYLVSYCKKVRNKIVLCNDILPLFTKNIILLILWNMDIKARKLA